MKFVTEIHPRGMACRMGPPEFKEVLELGLSALPTNGTVITFEGQRYTVIRYELNVDLGTDQIVVEKDD
jgi:hypothetical protein